MLKPITDITLVEMPEIVRQFDLKPFAANQIITWLYQRRVSSFDEMTDITKGARAALAEKHVIDAVVEDNRQEAADGTIKFLCRAHDGAAVECVYMPADEDRATVCISTQVGCAMGCSFCRTGGMGFVRNLTQGEILGQLILVMRMASRQITNIVLMGMGEPLANLDAVSNAVEVMIDHRAFNLSKRRITLSTAGLIPELKKFSERFDIKLAISLNATTDETRAKLMPINKRYPLADIMEFCRDYSIDARNRITFEYVLIRDVNDTPADMERLVRLLRGINAKVNLIPFNSFEKCEFKAPKEGIAEKWSDYLRDQNIQSNIRASRGQEIIAACGQLATSSNGCH